MNNNPSKILANCELLISAYRSGELGDITMPEDTKPDFAAADKELKLVYFTLPTSLNYQRDSFKLWEAVLKTFNDSATKRVFDLETSSTIETDQLREYLTKYKVALQPNKHISTWKTISTTVFNEWGSLTNFFEATDCDFLQLREIVQKKHKKGFPYLSGPKIFNYWSYIIQQYGGIELKNSEYIEIAPDTHVTKASVLLGVITEDEAASVSKELISFKWREILSGSGILPIEMHSPLWFWSRSGFKYQLG